MREEAALGNKCKGQESGTAMLSFSINGTRMQIKKAPIILLLKKRWGEREITVVRERESVKYKNQKRKE